MKHKNFLIFFVIAFLTVMAACSSDENVEEEAAGGDAAESENTGDLTIGTMADVVSLDLHGSNDSASSQVRTNIYERLLDQDVNMELQPGLATEYEQVDETTWNFKLREGTTFHNGEDFTAEDVVATFDRVRDEALASPVLFLFEMIEEVEVVNDYEINIHTSIPFAPLASHLAHSTAGIMPKELIDSDYQAALDAAGVDMTLEEYYEARDSGGEEYDSVKEHISEHVGTVIGSEPNGTNHLKYVSRSAGDTVELEKFEDFQGGDRYFENVTFKVIPESGARMAELETGGVQIATDVDSSSIDRIENGADTALTVKDSVRMSYLGFNMNKEPFDDIKVRQAISYAIDREEIVAGVYDDMGIPAKGPLAPGVWGYSEDLEGQEYNIEKAKELLAETDMADGFDTTIWVNDDQQIIDTAVYIQNELAELNINVEIEQFEWGAYLETLANGNHEMFILGWTTVTGDADYGLYALFHSKHQGAAGNRVFYDNPEVDELLDAGRAEVDDEARQQIYTDIEEILVEESPSSYLFHVQFAVGYNESSLSEVEIDPTGRVHLDTVRFK
ncbi:glutathione ABC transporter substrate-binding protein [Jeotgalicoccus halotolerans]|uniref:Peptide/nickel transport system substrate-binding protein n=1 Tax=Jeotgalicoccus halotolerans TaxID=157227 RepID=A0A3E0B1I0_9STAP|nr:glutathione ABC transporter substrate-binding protein [Jeotgalicoccus halotolerans]REG25829.1 peptide/nickel transport system substrate-binding protein [Jeotgalicoccus halotolerans]